MKMSDTPAKYEVLIKQYLRSILDISGEKVAEESMPFEDYDTLMFTNFY